MATSKLLASAFSASASRPKVALVTGATDGIGLTTAKNLAKKGYRVIVHGRNKDRIENACSIVNSFSGQPDAAIPALADLSSIAGCRQLISTIQSKLSSSTENAPSSSLDVIIHNAGVFADNLKLVGENDLEETFAVNVLAPFVLTSMLLPSIMERSQEKKKTRIIVVSSISQCSSISDWNDVAFYNQQRFSSHKTYSESKLLDAMLCYEMAHRLKQLPNPSYVTVNTLDPGTVNTKMLYAGWGYCGIDVERALDQTWLCTSDDVEGITGKYFVGRSERKSSGFAYDKHERKQMWDFLSRLAPDEAAHWDAL